MKKTIAILAALGIALLAFYFLSKGAMTPKLPAIALDKQNGYKLLVDSKPFIIRGVCYSPIPIGKDYEYNYWGDPHKPWLLDGKLMKEAGVNTVRIYRVGKNPEEVKQVLNDLYQKFGIHVLMGSYLGFWNWPPPNYTDDQFKEKVRTEVLEMVRLYKNCPGVLMWVLGNENNYSFDRQNIQRWSNDAIDALPDPEAQRKEKARIYYSFVNSLAQEIKKIDPSHPVVIGIGEVASLDIAKTQCPDVDVIGMIAYRGPGFGNLFRQIKQKFDLPVILSEWGADSFNAVTEEPDEEDQAKFIKLQWQDIERNADTKRGIGNCLGGTIFEWTDEWWKANENLPHTWAVHDIAAHWYNNSYYYDADVSTRLNMNEEWWGIVSIDPKKTDGGNNARIPKQSYYVLKALWNKKA